MYNIKNHDKTRRTLKQSFSSPTNSEEETPEFDKSRGQHNPKYEQVASSPLGHPQMDYCVLKIPNKY